MFGFEPPSVYLNPFGMSDLNHLEQNQKVYSFYQRNKCVFFVLKILIIKKICNPYLKVYYISLLIVSKISTVLSIFT